MRDDAPVELARCALPKEEGEFGFFAVATAVATKSPSHLSSEQRSVALTRVMMASEPHGNRC